MQSADECSYDRPLITGLATANFLLIMVEGAEVAISDIC